MPKIFSKEKNTQSFLHISLSVRESLSDKTRLYQQQSLADKSVDGSLFRRFLEKDDLNLKPTRHISTNLTSERINML